MSWSATQQNRETLGGLGLGIQGGATIRALAGHAAAGGEAILYRMSRPLARTLFRLLLRGGVRFQAARFELVVVGETDPEAAATHLTQVLELIRAHDPKRYAWLEAGVDTIALLNLRVKTSFVPSLRLVVLHADFFKKLGVDHKASVLIHEATHARLQSRGVEYSPLAKARIERVCLRNQVWFLDRLPDSRLLADITRADYEAIATRQGRSLPDSDAS